MAGNAGPRLVWILIRLAQNWAITKSRYERFNKRRRTNGVSAETDDDEGQALWDAFHDHPFPGFVRLVDHHIGFGQDAIRAAALKEFDGERELVAALNALDDKAVTAELFEKLRRECPGIIARLFVNTDGAKATTEPGTSALFDLLDQACNVFSLARSLGSELEKGHKSHGPVVMVGELSPRQRNAERIKEFTTAALEMRDLIENPPDGLADVAKQLREACRLAKLIRDATDLNTLDLWPDINSVALDGYEVVNVARKAARPDDPYAFLADAKRGKRSPYTVKTLIQFVTELEKREQTARDLPETGDIDTDPGVLILAEVATKRKQLDDWPDVQSFRDQCRRANGGRDDAESMRNLVLSVCADQRPVLTSGAVGEWRLDDFCELIERNSKKQDSMEPYSGYPSDPITLDEIAKLLGHTSKKRVQNEAAKWRKAGHTIEDPCSYAVIRPLVLATWSNKSQMFPPALADAKQILNNLA